MPFSFPALIKFWVKKYEYYLKFYYESPNVVPRIRQTIKFETILKLTFSGSNNRNTTDLNSL